MANEIVNWEEVLAADARAVAAVETPRVGKISLRAGQMTYEGNPVPENKLECVILASAVERAYYTSAFDPNHITSPACFALSITGEAMRPDPASTEPQHTDCATCPMNAWGSDPKGGRGKACKEGRRLVIMAVPKDAESAAAADMALLRIPVTSVRYWAAYVNTVAASWQRPPYAIITEISVAPDARTQFRVGFKTVGVLSDDVLGAVHGRIPAATAVALQPYEASAEPAADEVSSSSRKYAKK